MSNIEEEKEVIEEDEEVKKNRKLQRLKEEMVPVDEDEVNFINPPISEKVEKPLPYCTMAIPMYKFQREYVESIRRHLGLKSKSNFIRHCILTFCWNHKKILDIEKAADEELKIAYSKWRKKYFIKKMKLKERVAELNKMAPAQDEGDEDPFSAEDLME